MFPMAPTPVQSLPGKPAWTEEPGVTSMGWQKS